MEKFLIKDKQFDMLSDICLHHTRLLNEEKSWREWSTSGWRMMSNELLLEFLDQLFGEEGWTTEQKEWIRTLKESKSN